MLAALRGCLCMALGATTASAATPNNGQAKGLTSRALIVYGAGYNGSVFPQLLTSKASAERVGVLLELFGDYQESDGNWHDDPKTDNYYDLVAYRNRNDLSSAFESLKSEVVQDKVDFVLVYYVGHGIEDTEGADFVVPGSCRSANSNEIHGKCDSVVDLVNQVVGLRCSKRVVIVDSCRDKPPAGSKPCFWGRLFGRKKTSPDLSDVFKAVKSDGRHLQVYFSTQQGTESNGSSANVLTPWDPLNDNFSRRTKEENLTFLSRSFYQSVAGSPGAETGDVLRGTARYLKKISGQSVDPLEGVYSEDPVLQLNHISTGQIKRWKEYRAQTPKGGLNKLRDVFQNKYFQGRSLDNDGEVSQPKLNGWSVGHLEACYRNLAALAEDPAQTALDAKTLEWLKDKINNDVKSYSSATIDEKQCLEIVGYVVKSLDTKWTLAAN